MSPLARCAACLCLLCALTFTLNGCSPPKEPDVLRDFKALLMVMRGYPEGVWGLLTEESRLTLARSCEVELNSDQLTSPELPLPLKERFQLMPDWRFEQGWATQVSLEERGASSQKNNVTLLMTEGGPQGAQWRVQARRDPKVGWRFDLLNAALVEPSLSTPSVEP